MGGYINSGVAGKMDKIRNANPGSILVTDKFGNAAESITFEELGQTLEGMVNSEIGNLSNLGTTDKSNLVAAINELVTRVAALETSV